MAKNMPNYSEMTGFQLLEAFNELKTKKGEEPRKAKFKNASEGVEKCEALWKELNPTAEEKAAAKAKAAEEKAAKAGKANGKGKAKATEGERKSRRSATKIVILAKTNPYRVTSAAHAHFERMREYPLIEEYLASFPEEDRKTASQWLWNAENRGGHVRTE